MDDPCAVFQLRLDFRLPHKLSYYKNSTQPAFTCSKLTIETRCEICSKLTIKIPERRQWCHTLF